MTLADTRQICEDLARTYHYYLTGPTGLAEGDEPLPDPDGSDDSAEEAADPDSGDERAASRKRGRGGAAAAGGAAGTPARKRAAGRGAAKAAPSPTWGGAEPVGQPPLQLTVHLCRRAAGMRLAVDLRTCHADHGLESVERRAVRERRSVMEFGVEVPLAGGGTCRGVVRLFYFPRVRGEDRRPLAREEEADRDGPFLSVYWQGRWVPYAAVRVLDIFQPLSSVNASAAQLQRELSARVRGTIFFPRAMVPANSKLSLSESPEIALNGARYYPDGWSGAFYNARNFARPVATWLDECHKAFDREVLLEGRIAFDGRATTYQRARYGERQYAEHEKVRFKAGGKNVYATLRHFRLEGEHLGDRVTVPDAEVAYRREPRGLFRDEDSFTPIRRLAASSVTAAERAREAEVWRDGVAELERQRPAELLVLDGLSGREEAANLTVQQVQARQAMNKTLQLTAGAKTPGLAVFIRAHNGQFVTRLPGSALPGERSRDRTLNVRQLVYKMVDRGVHGTDDKPPGDGYIHGIEDARRKAEANGCYWIEPIAAALEGSGEYELRIQVRWDG